VIEVAAEVGGVAEPPLRPGGKVTKAFLLGGHATFILRTKRTERLYVVRGPWASWTGYPDARVVRKDAGQYLGMLDSVGRLRSTRRSQRKKHQATITQLRAVFWHVWYGAPLPRGWAIETTGRCGACNRRLKTAPSLGRGLGPSCVRKRQKEEAEALAA
jgi:hypothetical protein